MEKFLGRNLDSLLISDRDLLTCLDILVINDGSKDNSSSIAHSYEDRFPGIVRVIDKDNGNYGSCINRGLNEAKGKYVKILDADDTFHSDHFAGFVKFLSQADADCIISDMEKVNEGGDSIHVFNYDLPEYRVFSLADLGKYAWTMWMHCVCYKTEKLRTISYRQTEGISYTDQEWIFLPMSTVTTLSYFPKVIYRYLVGRKGQTINPATWDKNFWQEIKGADVMMEEFNSIGTSCVEDVRSYLRIRIQARIRAIYKAFFLRLPSFTNNEIMIDFDQKVKEFDQDYYNLFNEYHVSRLYPFHYIKHWRNDNYSITPIIRTNKIVYKALCFFKGHEF